MDIQFCLGAPLARLEAKVMLEMMLSRLKDLQRLERESFRSRLRTSGPALQVPNPDALEEGLVPLPAGQLPGEPVAEILDAEVAQVLGLSEQGSQLARTSEDGEGGVHGRPARQGLASATWLSRTLCEA